MLPRVSRFAAKVCLIVLAFSTVIIAVADNPDDQSYAADCVPKNPLFASWTTLEINCTLNRTLPGPVACKFGTEFLQTTVIGDGTFQVTKENVTRNMSQGHVFCHVNVSGKQLQIAQVVIRVADIPTSPNITGCVVYNWERMVCTWGEAPDTGLPTNYTLAWTVLDSYHSCPHPKGNTCEWRKEPVDGLRMDMEYSLVLLAKNALKMVESPKYRYLTTDIVKPNPVTHLMDSNVTEVSAELRWTWIDSSPSERLLIFRISYVSEWDTENKTEETVDKNITVVNLLPFTKYSVSVECIPYIDGHSKGFWSNKTLHTFRTLQSVPSMAPATTSGGYHVRSVSDKDRSVDVFWQPLHPKFLQGKLARYRLSLFNASDGRNLRVEFTNNSATYFHRVNLPPYLDVDVTVEAETERGRNESLELNAMIIRRCGSAPQKPDIYYSIGYRQEIVVGWSPVSNASGYTVFWCRKGSTERCENSLSWESLPQNVTNFTIPIGSSKFNEYFVAISVEAYDDKLQRVVSSGFVDTECVHDGTKEVQRPENFRRSHDQQAYNFTVEWEKPNCHRTAFILNYELLYCERQTCDDRHICCQENRSVIISNSKTKFTITDLKTDVEYEAWIRSQSLVGYSQFTSPAHHVVFRSGLSAGVIAAIVIAAIFLLILMTISLVTIAKNMKKNCCREIKIIPPPPVVFVPIPNDPYVSDSGYNDGLAVVVDDEETRTLLKKNSIGNVQENDNLKKQPPRSNGNVEHQVESIQPFAHEIEEEPPCELEVEPANDSSISPYTHWAVPEDSATDRSVDSRDVSRSTPYDADSRVLPVICPAACVVPHSEPKLHDAKSESGTRPSVPVGQNPSSGNSSSAIALYTTIEQIVEPDTAQLAVDPDGSGSYINPKTSDNICCRNGAAEIGDVKGISVAQIDACGHNGIVTNSQPAYTNQQDLAGGEVFKDYVVGSVASPSAKPALSVNYIPVAPTTST